MNTQPVRRAFWGGLQHHHQTCEECAGFGIDDDGDECVCCDGEKKLFWGSFYGERGECEFCKHGGDGDVLVASMYEGDPAHEYVCLRCYLKHHREACGCNLWAAIEAYVRWPEPLKATA